MSRAALFQRLSIVLVPCAVVAGAARAQPLPLHRGAIGFGSWNTTVEFKDIVVSSNGVALYLSDFAKTGTNGLTILRGNWSVRDGVLRQSAIEPQCRVFLGDRNWANYTVSLRARSTGGQEGFAVYFNALDGNTWTWFSVAGWTNTLASIDQQQGGGSWTMLCERVPLAIDTNVWYDVRVVLDGPRIECYVNSNLVQMATYSAAPSPIRVAAAGNSGARAATRKGNDSVSRFLNPPFRGAVGVGAWDTVTEFRNIIVSSNDGVLYRSDFDKEDIGAWHTIGGSWVITNGVLRQTAVEFNCFATIGDTNWSNYTLSLQARKISGDEGFCALVGWIGDGNHVWFNVGSWGDHSAEIYQDVMGRRAASTERVPLSVESGIWYDVRVVVEGARVSCYLNGNLIQTVVAQVLVSTESFYLGSVPTPDGNALRFRLGKEEFTGNLAKDRGGPPALEPGSLVQLTGTVQPGLDSAANSGLQIWSPADILLLAPPSWWTWKRILWFGGASLAILITAVIWIAMISHKNRLLTIAQGELQKANDELEVRVQQRTADLARANAELEHEQALLRTLLDNASDYIYFKDLDSKFVRCSGSLCKLAGFTHEQLVGKTDLDVFRVERAQSALQDEQKIIRTGQPLLGKLEEGMHADGRLTWVLTTKMPWRDPAGKVLGTFGISCDITSIKQAEANLARAHEQLLEASRLAGMAEVATGVLHNVGNVLNSVNVSTTLLAEQLRNSKVKSVARVAALMTDHAPELGDFITKDPRGQRLTGFLRALSAHLETERTKALEELAGLQKSIEHIKEIVAMQQGYASVAGVTTIVNITELLEDVLRLAESSLMRHGVKVVKEFDPNLPDISMDRHKALQILVNLVRNAKQACGETGSPDKELTLRATTLNGKINLSVADNGIGIPAENLTRIFTQGFTTRKNGHGFGLHTSALAAKQIGGRLSVQSEGPGKGATFTLELTPNLKTRAQDSPAANCSRTAAAESRTPR